MPTSETEVSHMELDTMVSRGVRHVTTLTQLKPGRVVSLKPKGNNGAWLLRLELVEKESIPDSMDILGVYEVELDHDGNVTEFARSGLRQRRDTG